MASTNNCLNNASSTAIANAVQTFTVSNSDNTGSSAAQVQVSVGGGTTTGDAQQSYVVTGATTWSEGVDNSDSDSYVVCPSATLGTTNSHVILTNGFNRWPLQPAILAILTANSNNRTGNGSTPFNIGAATAPYTVVFNKAGGITLGVYTAQVTGKYYVGGSITLTGCVTNTFIQIQLITSNRTYVKTLLQGASAADTCINMNTIADLDAADTAILRVSGGGETSNVEDLVGGTATAQTYFNIYLAN